MRAGRTARRVGGAPGRQSGAARGGPERAPPLPAVRLGPGRRPPSPAGRRTTRSTSGCGSRNGPDSEGEQRPRRRANGGFRLPEHQPEASHELQIDGPTSVGRPSDRGMGIFLAERRGGESQSRVGIPGHGPSVRLSSCRHRSVSSSCRQQAGRIGTCPARQLTFTSFSGGRSAAGREAARSRTVSPAGATRYGKPPYALGTGTDRATSRRPSTASALFFSATQVSRVVDQTGVEPVTS